MTGAPSTRSPLRPGVARSLALAALCLLAAAAIAAVPALAAKPPKQGGHSRGARIEVLAPRFDARVGATFEARIKVSTVAGFSASLAGHNVTGRFHRHGAVMEAELRRGRDFDLGANSLVVAAGTGRAMRATTVRFYSRSKASGLLTITRLDPNADRTPVRFRITAAAPLAQLEVTVNGRRYAVGPLERRRSWTVVLGADDGLRYGANTLRVAGERIAGGRFDRESLRFKVGRGAPLVSAGPDRITRPGRGIVLDGSETRGGEKLAYRWQIVAQPRGSHTGIVDGTGRQARLLPDLPGTYRVRLVAAPATKADAAAEAKGAMATASDSSAPEPVCLPNVPIALIPASTEHESGTATGAGSSASTPLSPLEAPVCVTPTGETTPVPLTPANPGATAADEMEVLARPTLAPMGWPIETIATDGSTRVGPQIYKEGPGFAHLLLLNYESLKLESEKFFPLDKAEEMASAVEDAGPKQVVVLTGMGQAQSEAPKQAQEALAKAIKAIGGNAPAAAERAGIIESGRWSVIGMSGLPAYYASNLFGAAAQTPVEATVGSLPGSLNGHMQTIKGGVYSFVSAEYVPIDTKATGSTDTLSVFKVGGQTVTSEQIPQGTLALHIAVFDAEAAGGALTPVGNVTYVIDNPYSSTNLQGVREAAEYLEHWRTAETNDVIVLQTFGEETVGQNTAPWGAPNWVNDALIAPGNLGLYNWHKQPYVSIKNESETEAVLDRFWNPGYPTVAGQVGDLTGPAGHDLVADLGAGNPYVEVTRLTMVASNHAQNPEANYVSGDAETIELNSKGQRVQPPPNERPIPEGRLVGTLTRNPESGWTVQSASAAASFAPSKIWEIAYAEPTAWPDSQTSEQKEAMLWIAKQIFGQGTAITDVRTQYAAVEMKKLEEDKEGIERLPSYESGSLFSKTTLRELREQLLVELRDVIRVRSAIDGWKSIYGNQVGDLVQVNNVSGQVTKEVIHNAEKEKKTEVEVSPAAIFAESLYTASDLVGFPEIYAEAKLPELLGTIAGSIALAEESTPEVPEGPEAPESALIRAEADQIGTKLAEHVENADAGLTQLEEILVSDWGKLKIAAQEAAEGWRIEKTPRTRLEQALAINTKRALYEGVLPTAFEQWVVSPYYTAWNTSGPQAPGAKTYTCRHYREDEPGFSLNHPFKNEPFGGVDTAIYRPWNEPGSKTAPAQGYTVPYTIRALKSTSSNLKMQEVELTDSTNALSIKDDGSNPKASLVNPLFEAVRNGEGAANPKRLGINKVEFFADYGGGPADWSRTICAEGPKR